MIRNSVNTIKEIKNSAIKKKTQSSPNIIRKHSTVKTPRNREYTDNDLKIDIDNLDQKDLFIKKTPPPLPSSSSSNSDDNFELNESPKPPPLPLTEPPIDASVSEIDVEIPKLKKEDHFDSGVEIVNGNIKYELIKEFLKPIKQYNLDEYDSMLQAIEKSYQDLLSDESETTEMISNNIENLCKEKYKDIKEEVDDKCLKIQKNVKEYLDTYIDNSDIEREGLRNNINNRMDKRIKSNRLITNIFHLYYLAIIKLATFLIWIIAPLIRLKVYIFGSSDDNNVKKEVKNNFNPNKN